MEHEREELRERLRRVEEENAKLKVAMRRQGSNVI
jgi:predicted nuclease with TOPRIM domain